jgi:ABC-type nitrate/sulfonate/bicarbonate transport system substrate-binding protein
MTTLKLALDWTPNTNHIGFFIAKELGFYKENGIELEILNPIDDNYQLTPGKKLELDIADFAIAPFETVISSNNKANQVQAIAIYAILQEDLSSIVSLKQSNINSPRFLDGKIYASYKARYEDHIVNEMIKNDGGEGKLKIIYPEKLGIWNTLLNNQADATWIFDNWEGIEAKSKNIQLNNFTLSQFQIPYGYSPIVIAKREKITAHKELYSKFIKATKSGFMFVKNNQKESSDILRCYLSDHDLENIDIEQSISYTIPHFGNETNCGMMEQNKILKFSEWLVEKGLEDQRILKQKLFTNELFN